MFLTFTSDVEIASAVFALKDTCSPGYDEISVSPIKAAICDISAPLTYICNRMLETGIFPGKMKVARVTVIHKGGSKNDLNNYRPISVLPLFSKIAERIIYKQLYDFIQVKNIISKHQYGFQCGKSVESALLQVKEKILSNFEQRYFTVGIFLDFRKAFDSIKHQILFHKLTTYSIRKLALT